MIDKLKTLPADRIPPCTIYSELVKLTGLRNSWTAGKWLKHLTKESKKMYKLSYTGNQYPELIKNMIEAESYKNELEAETNKRITCALLNIAPENITITKTEK